jgi:serine/threonine protein kinase
MAFIEGGTLREWLSARQPSPREGAEMIARIARAMGYAHEHGVIHRDLKPSNVMIDNERDRPVARRGRLVRRPPRGT